MNTSLYFCHSVMPSRMPLAACLYLTSSSSMGRLSCPSMSRDYHVTSYDVIGVIIRTSGRCASEGEYWSRTSQKLGIAYILASRPLSRYIYSIILTPIGQEKVFILVRCRLHAKAVLGERLLDRCPHILI